jgi:hypothetical protein
MAKRETKKQVKTATSKTASKKGAVTARTRRATKAQIKQKNKKLVRSRQSLAGSFRLTQHTFMFIKKHWRPLGGIVLVYTLLNLFLASGFIGNTSSIMRDFEGGKFSDALSGYSSILSAGSGQATTMQTILLIIESLVIIWALRHLFSGEKINVKHAYYHASGPMVPFVIVLFVIVLQLLPLTFGSLVLAIVLSSIAGNSLVETISTLIFVALAFWSLYMVCSSVFALYIVTLPNMQPREALRSARNLVHFRRWHVVRRLLFLPLSLIIFIGIFIVPLILLAKFLVVPTFFTLSMLSILYAHTYLYTLYKGLLE